LQVVSAKDKKTLHKFIREHTHPDTEAIYTDDWPSYSGIADKNTKHEVVNHSLDEWRRDDVHTNSIENIWSLLKRSIMGSYHKISLKHLNAYLDELEWRFNNRDNPYLFNETLGKLIGSKNLEYKELVATNKS
jgi:transposase-like protein